MKSLSRFLILLGFLQESSASMLGLIFSTAILVASGLRFSLLVGRTRYAQSLAALVGHRVFRSYFSRDYEDIMSKDFGTLTSLVTTKVNTVIRGAIMPVFVILNAILVIFAMFLALIYTSSFELLVPIAIILITYFITAYFSRKFLRLMSLR